MRTNKVTNLAFRSLLSIAAISLLGITQTVNAQGVPFLREGDTILKAKLINEDGAPISLSDPEQATILTFIFTRCAAMQFCPKMNAQFEALQTRAQADETLNPRLVSISLAPEFDRPERLKVYGNAIGANPAIWHFATGSTEAIDQLTKAFRVYRDDSEGVLNHTLCTALVAPDGTILKIWRGNAWQVEEVLEALK